MDQDAGGKRAGAEACPAKDEAYADQEKERARGVAGLFSVHPGEGDAGEDGAEEHGHDGPLGVAVFVCGEGRVAGEAFGGPVVSGAEGGQEKSAEDDLFKERREGDAKGEHEPGGAGGAEDLVDGRVLGAGHEEAVDEGKDKAEDGGGKQAAAQVESGLGAPLQAVEEAFVPEERKDEDGQAEG